MQQRELFGNLSFIDGQLLLDNVLIADGQLVAAKHGESEYLLGRIRVDPKGHWFLDHSEFVGHTYVNVPLIAPWLNGLIVKRVKGEKGSYEIES